MHLTQRTVRFVACRRCEGLKRQACSSCRGQGFQTQGAMRRRHDGSVEYCAEHVPCGPCYGVGYVPCTGCGGKGRVIR